MTTSELRNAGYRVSAQVSDTEVSRAAQEVTEAYIAKVSSVGQQLTPDQNEAAMQLVTILLIRRSAVATRSGGKEKTSPQLSERADASQGELDNADRLLRKIQTVAGNISELVDDIASIYYRRIFIGL